MKRFLVLSTCAAGAALALTSVSALALGPDPVTGTLGQQHIFRTVGAVGIGGPDNLIYSGGPVETAPTVFVSWWGPEWAAGFSTGGYTSAQAQTYITDFFNGVGGSSWNNVDTQYCQGAPVNATSCPSGATFIPNSAGQLGGTWNDSTPVPVVTTDGDIAAAAVRAMNHFGYSRNATYFVYTPHGKSELPFGVVYCAYHNVTTVAQGDMYFAYMPYQPDAGSSCGVNFVNKTNDAYGHGYFDGFSIVGGHEYAEAQTDPGAGSGWVDSAGMENGDKCAWSAQSGNTAIGGQTFAVQPIWSNRVSGCAMS